MMDQKQALQARSQFLRYDNARKIQSPLFDHTNGAAAGYAERLNGSANEIYGIARSISVMPGDTINAEVYAKYIDTNSSNWTAALNTLLTQIANGTTTAGTVIDGSGYSSSTSSFTLGGLIDKSGANSIGPKAYLNWLVFDRNYVLLNGGYKKMSDVAKEYGQDVAHEYLSSPDILITEPGYVYIYLSNEESTPVEVYFDDLKITHTKSRVVQAQDYFAFGLTYNSYQRENGITNDYLYNGKEQQDELNLAWLDYGARMYMPEIGRWGVIDPMAELSRRWTPYRYGFDNPLRFIDPDGMFEYSNGYSTTNSRTETGAVEHWQVSDDQMKQARKEFVSNLFQKLSKTRNNYVVFNSGNYLKNYIETTRYMTSQSKKQGKLVVGFGLTDGSFVVLPTEGYAYKGRRRTKERLENGSDYDNLYTNLIPSKGNKERFKVKVDGTWVGVNDYIISIPNVSRYYIQLGIERESRQWILPFIGWEDKGREMGAENLILLYNRPLGGPDNYSEEFKLKK